MLLSAASLLYGERNETLVQYQNWMGDTDFDTPRQIGEAIQAYLRESPLSLAHSIEQFKQPVNRPNPQLYLDDALKAYSKLTNPTRFGFTKGINMMRTMREALEWQGVAMQSNNLQDLEKLKSWADHLDPNHQITQWDGVTQPTHHDIQGRVRQELVSELRAFRTSLRQWIEIQSAPKDNTTERAHALKNLALITFQESEGWGRNLVDPDWRSIYPTLSGFTNMLLCCTVAGLKPIEKMLSKGEQV